MTIPKKEQFDQFLVLAKGANAGHLVREFNSEIFLANDQTTAIDLLERANAFTTQQYRLMDEDPVMKWLVAQDAFNRAYDRTFSTRRKRSKDSVAKPSNDYLARTLHRLREAAAMPDAIKKMEEFSERRNLGWEFEPIFSWTFEYTRFGTRVRQALGGKAKFYVDFIVGIVPALIEYYFSPEAAKEIATKKKRIDTAIAEAAAAVSQLKAMLSDEFLGEAINSLPGNLKFSTSAQLRQIDRQIALFSALEEVPVDLAYPIARVDGTSRERLLVFRLYKFNRKQFMASKSEAICCLLQLEGINAPMDRRTVERLCAQFLDDSRQLYRKLRSITVTTENDSDTSVK